MQQRLITCLGMLFILLIRSPYANAEPVYNPATGHYYDAIAVPGGLTWLEAETAANSLNFMGAQGHLATLTNQEENDFISINFPQACSGSYCLGGFQSPGSPEPASGWEWVTGELWAFTNWAPGEPNNSGGMEDILHLQPTCQWNDNSEESLLSGFVVEYSGAFPEPELLSFTSIVPCRIVDTRLAGGALSPGEIRSYNVWGDVASQGGNPTGCHSVWGEPSAVQVNVTAVPVVGGGNIGIFPFRSTPPKASFVNYKTGVQNIANSGAIKTCFNCDNDISIQSKFGTAQVVIDVLGYYHPSP